MKKAGENPLSSSREQEEEGHECWALAVHPEPGTQLQELHPMHLGPCEEHATHLMDEDTEAQSGESCFMMSPSDLKACPPQGAGAARMKRTWSPRALPAEPPTSQT